MSSSKGPSRITVFLAGLGIGAIIALLFAPRSGEETRELIGRKAEKGREYIENKGRELRRHAEEAVEKGKRSAEELVEKGKNLVARATS